MEEGKFCTLTCTELKKELSRRGARVTGRKAELLHRLQDYEKNQDFRGDTVVLPEPLLVDWPTAGFKQLTGEMHEDIPPMSQGYADGYFMLRMGLDRRAVGDCQALAKGRLLLDSKWVEACSYVCDGTSHFFSGICKAAMKKGLSYSLRLKADDHGEILNSHCECPAGKGPHGTCKHVAALILTLIHFKDTQDMSGMNEGCRDRLQGFHRPAKKYQGSPVKAEDLPGYREVDLDDPRPPSMRNREGKQDHFRNMVANYVGASGHDIAARYMFPKADLQTATHDHDYLDAPLTEHLIRRKNKISRAEAISLEKST